MNRFYQASMGLLCVAAVWLVLQPWSVERVRAQAREPVATVAGQAIYEEDLLPRIQSQLLQLRNQEYEIKRQALEGLLNQRVVEAEAQKKGLTTEELLKQEVDSKVPEATDAEVEAFYQAQKDRINRPLAEVQDQLRQMLKQSRQQEARRQYFQSLRERAAITVYLQPPRLEVSYDPARVRGKPDARVTIVEFSDFQCPYCQRAYSTLKSLLSKYEGRVKLAYRDFPLDQIHPEAHLAAAASRCAGEQNKFWEYHDLLFENSGSFRKPDLVKHAASLQLDSKQFDECLDADKFGAQIAEDLQEGQKAGVSGTPAFFINGVFLNGAQPAAAFERIIEGELAAGTPKPLPE